MRRTQAYFFIPCSLTLTSGCKHNSHTPTHTHARAHTQMPFYIALCRDRGKNKKNSCLCPPYKDFPPWWEISWSGLSGEPHSWKELLIETPSCLYLYLPTHHNSSLGWSKTNQRSSRNNPHIPTHTLLTHNQPLIRTTTHPFFTFPFFLRGKEKNPPFTHISDIYAPKITHASPITWRYITSRARD